MKYWKIRISVWILIVLSGLAACSKQIKDSKLNLKFEKLQMVGGLLS
jgi:hypothetical protein